jgi:RNA polymerase sigma-70 factor (ECF subfamily)
MTVVSVAGDFRASDMARRFDAVVTEHFDLIWRVLRRLGASAADADDCIQEVFMVAARRFESIKPGSERAFLIAVATRVFSTQRRGIRRRREEPASHPEEIASLDCDPLESLELSEARRLLAQVLEQLPLELRTVLVLYELEELSVAEIAALLNAPRGTISWRLKTARDAFAAAVRRLRARQRHPMRAS